MRFSIRPKVSVVLSLVTMFIIVGALVLAVVSHRSGIHAAGLTPTKSGKRVYFKLTQLGVRAPTDAQCRARSGVPCYSPQEMRAAYGVASLMNAGFTGKGQTIVVIDSFGSPTISADLHTFDVGYGLPDPPSFQVLSPLGTVPFDVHNSDMVNWAEETSLDVEWAHALAPGANIVLMTSPIAETEGVQGMPEFLALEQYALNHHLGNIISQSWGATENTLFSSAGQQVFANFESFYQSAANQHVTVFAAAGDGGSSNVDVNGKTYPFPTVLFPASSPWVTTVGGTSLRAATSGNYQSETVWNDSDGAGGGGVTQVFKEPGYQKLNLPLSVQSVLKGHRGIPDIAYNADPSTGVPIYVGFLPQHKNGYYMFGGTSAGAPQWAGIIADANQLAGHPLGFLNTALYQLGNSNAARSSFHDVTAGNNGLNGVPGYKATPGWDLASGWGSPQAATLVPNLIKLLKGN